MICEITHDLYFKSICTFNCLSSLGSELGHFPRRLSMSENADSFLWVTIAQMVPNWLAFVVGGLWCMQHIYVFLVCTFTCAYTTPAV